MVVPKGRSSCVTWPPPPRRRRQAVRLSLCTSRPQQLAYRISLAHRPPNRQRGGGSTGVRVCEGCCPRGARRSEVPRDRPGHTQYGLAAPVKSRPSLPSCPSEYRYKGAQFSSVVVSRVGHEHSIGVPGEDCREARPSSGLSTARPSRRTSSGSASSTTRPTGPTSWVTAWPWCGKRRFSPLPRRRASLCSSRRAT